MKGMDSFEEQSILKYLTTGNLGSLRIDFTTNQVRALLGEPDEIFIPHIGTKSTELTKFTDAGEETISIESDYYKPLGWEEFKYGNLKLLLTDDTHLLGYIVVDFRYEDKGLPYEPGVT